MIPWSAIRAIVTYKRDLFSYDGIFIAFKLGDDDWIEVCEDEPHFAAFVDDVHERFPDVPRDWRYKVMFPAFETNYRVLWGDD